MTETANAFLQPANDEVDNLPTIVDAVTEQAVVQQDPVVISGPSSDTRGASIDIRGASTGTRGTSTTLTRAVQALTSGVQAAIGTRRDYHRVVSHLAELLLISLIS